MSEPKFEKKKEQYEPQSIERVGGKGISKAITDILKSTIGRVKNGLRFLRSEPGIQLELYYSRKIESTAKALYNRPSYGVNNYAIQSVADTLYELLKQEPHEKAVEVICEYMGYLGVTLEELEEERKMLDKILDEVKRDPNQ